MRSIIGIDPGLKGGAAQIDIHGNLLRGFCWNDKKRIEVQPFLHEFTKMLHGEVVMVVVENVHAMPGEGRSSGYVFGRATGTLEGIAQAYQLPLSWLTPNQWKSRLRIGKDKDESRVWAQRRWPTMHDQYFKVKWKGQAIGDAAGLAVAWMEMHPEVHEVSHLREKTPGIG